MKQRSVVTINLLLLVIWLWLLISYTGMSKTEYLGTDVNLYYYLTIWTMYVLALFYARLFVSKYLLLNVIITTLLFKLAYIIRYFPTDLLIGYLLRKDQERTPLGWTFNYRFLDLAVVNVFLLLAFEIVRGIIPAKWCLVRTV